MSLSFCYGITGCMGFLQDSCGFGHPATRKSLRDITEFTEKWRTFLAFVAALDPAGPPGDVSRRRSKQFIDDAHTFIASGFTGQAAALALGRSDADLFGCDDIQPSRGSTA